MNQWTISDLHRLDRGYAEQGVHLHQRPFRAAMDLLGHRFSVGVGGNPEARRIMDAYAQMMPEVEESWPGAGGGLVASVDQVRRIVFPVVFGTNALEPWQLMGFSDREEWANWCRHDRDIAAETALATADVHDFAMGLDQIADGELAAVGLWRMARSNLENTASILRATFGADTVLQPICLVAELSIKAALVWGGVDPNSFRRERNGHDLVALAARMASDTPHRDDARVADVMTRLPPYVASRYAPAGLTRLNVVRLALGVQFVAASSLRRIAGVDLAVRMETDDEWPGPRREFVA